MSKMLTPKEVAHFFGVTPTTLSKWRKQRDAAMAAPLNQEMGRDVGLKYYRDGGRIYYEYDDIVEFKANEFVEKNGNLIPKALILMPIQCEIRKIKDRLNFLEEKKFKLLAQLSQKEREAKELERSLTSYHKLKKNKR